MAAAKVKRIWVPGFEKRLAAGSNGILYRYRKTKKTLEPIPLVSPNQRVFLSVKNAPNKSHTYATLIALAWVPNMPPHELKPQAKPTNGDPMDTRPENLYWWTPKTAQFRLLRKKRLCSLVRAQSDTSDNRDTYKRLDQAPHHFIKSNGTLWKLGKDNVLKQKHGSLNAASGRVYVSLKPDIDRRQFPLIEIVADLFLPPKPGPLYRATPKDGNPANTHPNNIEWRFNPTPPRSRSGYFPITFTNGYNEERYANPTYQAHDEIREAQDILRSQGGRRLAENIDVWALPTGRVFRISLDWALSSRDRMEELKPNASGKIWFIGGVFSPWDDKPKRTKHNPHQRVYTPKGVNIFNLIADAFPDLLDRVRIPGQECYPKDGNWHNPHPSNIAYADKPNHALSQRKWQFVMDEPLDPVQAWKDSATETDTTRSVDTPTHTPTAPLPLNDDLENWL